MKLLLNIALIWLLASCGSSTAENNNLPAGSTEKETSLSGEQLFKINCSQCHMPDKDFIAPSMAGVESRWKDKALLYAFVKNSQEVIQRDQYAKDLFIKWKQT
ncbi:MAG TPA: c-type cytochrome, partial [Ferruginibacter sp.]|nr:c-type cytochrome [Ferruginibacter sp.]